MRLGTQSAIVHVRATPRSSRCEVSDVKGGTLHVRITAPPADGEANKAVIETVAKALKVSKSLVRIKAGASSRQKTLEISQVSQDEIDSRIAAICK